MCDQSQGEAREASQARPGTPKANAAARDGSAADSQGAWICSSSTLQLVAEPSASVDGSAVHVDPLWLKILGLKGLVRAAA